MRNDELHCRTVEVLTSLVDVLNADDLSLLCWHAGVRVTDLMPVNSTVTGELFTKFIEQEKNHAIQG